MKIRILNYVLAVIFFGSIAISTLMGIGDIDKIDTPGDWFALIAIISGAVWTILYIAFSENYIKGKENDSV